VAQDTDRWWAAMKTVVYLLIIWKAGNVRIGITQH
jgi:hypothetical protein